MLQKLLKAKYVLSVAVVIFSTQAKHECDTNIKQVVLSDKVYGALALGAFVDSANKTTLLTVTPQVQLWQKNENSWESIATLKPLCEPQTAQVVINPEINQPTIVTGAGSCLSPGSKKGVFVVWQEEEGTWKATSSEVVASGQPFTYIDTYFTNTTTTEPVIAAGYSNQTALFFENTGTSWQEVSSLDRVIKSFYIPGYGQCAVSQTDSSATQLEFWLYIDNSWQLAQSFDIGQDVVYAADFMFVDGLPTVVAGTFLGNLITAQLQNDTWVFSKQTNILGGTIYQVAHVQLGDQAYLILPSLANIYIYKRNGDSWQVLKALCLSFYGDYIQGVVGGFVDEDNNLVISASYGDMYCSWTKDCKLGLFYINS